MNDEDVFSPRSPLPDNNDTLFEPGLSPEESHHVLNMVEQLRKENADLKSMKCNLESIVAEKEENEITNDLILHWNKKELADYRINFQCQKYLLTSNDGTVQCPEVGFIRYTCGCCCCMDCSGPLTDVTNCPICSMIVMGYTSLRLYTEPAYVTDRRWFEPYPSASVPASTM